MKMNPFRFVEKLFREKQFKSIKSEFILGSDDAFQKKGELIEKEVFSGGPIEKFSPIGRLYLITLLKIGITPESKVLDIGCGALRGGYWLIHFLNPNGYFGIEPNKEMLEVGKRILLDSKTLGHKEPKFDHNTDFDLSVFDQKFDYIIARSIWSHTSKLQIEKTIDEFVSNSTPSGVLLASYLKPYSKNQDYKDNEWVGKSHDSDESGVVYHSLSWIQNECDKRGLKLRELKFDYYDQIWLHISK